MGNPLPWPNENSALKLPARKFQYFKKERIPKFTTSAAAMIRRLRTFTRSLNFFFSSRLHSVFFSFIIAFDFLAV